VALVGGGDLANVLTDVAEAARRATRCARIEVAATGGPSAAVAGTDATALVAMLTLPAGPGHTVTFFRTAGTGQLSAEEAERARRYARVAGLVVHGASLTSSRAAAVDHQTGAVSRADFERAVARASRDGDAAALVVARVVDLQQVNSRFGREVSDEVLRFVARTLDAAGVVGRVAREDLAALVTGPLVADVDELVERLRAAVTRSPLPVLGRDDVHATIAIGHAVGAASTTLFHDAYGDLSEAVKGLAYEPRRSRRFW
jgi:diguanylate cyclase (GGDEF)-like protein